VGDGGGVPREAGGWVGLMFEAMVSPNQKKKEKGRSKHKGKRK